MREWARCTGSKPKIPRIGKAPAFLFLAFWLALAAGLAAARADEVPAILVTIKPLHSLTAILADGRANPQLLLEQGGSVHEAMLRPSQRARLAKADIIIWTGPELEGWLVRLLADLRTGNSPPALLQATRLAGLDLLAARHIDDDHEDHEDDEDHDDDHVEDEDHHDGDDRHQQDARHDRRLDPHFWLDPRRAGQMAVAITALLSQQDPQGAPIYLANLGQLLGRLDQLQDEITSSLAGYRNRQVIVWHDAFQYFEQAAGLPAARFAALQPEALASVSRLRELRSDLAGAACIMDETESHSAPLQILAKEANLPVIQLDPAGSRLAPGPSLYFDMMAGLLRGYQRCFEPK